MNLKFLVEVEVVNRFYSVMPSLLTVGILFSSFQLGWFLCSSLIWYVFVRDC